MKGTANTINVQVLICLSFIWFFVCSVAYGYELSIEVSALAFSPDGKILASGGEHQSIKLWDVTTGRCLQTMPNEVTEALAFSPDGKILASDCAMSDGEDSQFCQHCIKLWDVATGKQLKILCGHKAVIDSLTFSPDGKKLASGSWDSSAKLWDITNGKELRTFAEDHWMIKAVGFSLDGKSLVTVDNNSSIKLWDVLSGKNQNTITRPMKLMGNRFTIQGKTCAGTPVPQSDVVLNIYKSDKSFPVGLLGALDATSGGRKGRKPTEQTKQVNTDQGMYIRDVATSRTLCSIPADTSWASIFSPDGKMLATSGMDEMLRLWDVASGRELHSLTWRKPRENTGLLYSAAFSPNGQMVAAGGDYGAVILWDVTSGRKIRVFGKHRIWHRKLDDPVFLE